MLVRDDAETIQACLESVREHVDAYILQDTGSQDETIEIAEAFLAGLPGLVVTEGWEGFATNRTKLLRAAEEHGDYILMLDADHVVTTHGPLPELVLDAYQVQIDDHWGGWLPLITKAGLPFYYAGVAHASLHCEVEILEGKLEAISIQGGPGASREKLERDLAALKAAHFADPTDARTVFYLAQTYRDLGNVEMAVIFFRMRAEMQGFEEERFFAQYQLGILLGENVGVIAGAKALVAAFSMRPTRAEPLRALARIADSAADKLTVPDDTLFVMPGAYKEAQ